jgi:hypothetical protein
MSRVCIPVTSSNVIGLSGSTSNGKVCISSGTGVIIGVPTTPITSPSANILRVEPTITGLTGGGSTNLDGINTVSGNFPAGICVFIVINNIPNIYQLVEGQEAESLPFVVRPDDYDNQAEKKVWKLRM